MKTIADLTVKQLNMLARITMLDSMRQVVFMGDSPAEVFKEHFKDSMNPYMLRILLKLLPDLNEGRTPVIVDSDEPGLMLVKAAWCGIRAYGLQNFFVAAKAQKGLGSFKTEYLFDSIHQGDFTVGEPIAVRQALELYVSMIEEIYASNSSIDYAVNTNKLLKTPAHNIGDYWNNVLAARHLGKDPAKWAEHAEKNKSNVHA